MSGAGPEEAGPKPERAAQKRQPCAFFLKTGSCAFGNQCKFEHPADQPPTRYNSLGLPLRENEPDCAYYVKNLHCGYGASCKFHHAEPEIRWMPMPVLDGHVAGSLPSGYRVLQPNQMLLQPQQAIPAYSQRPMQPYGITPIQSAMLPNQYAIRGPYGMNSGVVPGPHPPIRANMAQLSMPMPTIPLMMAQGYQAPGLHTQVLPTADNRQVLAQYSYRPRGQQRALPSFTASQTGTEAQLVRESSSSNPSRLNRPSILSGGPSRAGVDRKKPSKDDFHQ